MPRLDGRGMARYLVPGSVALLIGLLALAPLPAGAQTAADPSADAPAITRVPPGNNQVALTFDGADWPGRISDILAVLARHRVHATFFLTGGYLSNWPRTTGWIAAAGNEIASHSYHHVDLTGLSNQAILDEIWTQQEMLHRVIGTAPPPYWRPPYGASDDRVVAQARRLGYRTILWSLDSLDTVGPPKSASFIYHRLLDRSRRELDGAIILVHVNPNGTVDALDRVLTGFEQLGLQQVTVGDLLNAAP